MSTKLKTILRYALLITSLSWAGCGCVQKAPSEAPTLAPATVDPQELDVSAIAKWHERTLQLTEVVQNIDELGKDTWLEHDALHQTPESLLQIAHTAMFNDNDSDSLKYAIAMIEQTARDCAAHPDDVSHAVDHYDQAEAILKRLRTDQSQNSVGLIIPDVLDYYLGIIALNRFELTTSQNDALAAADAFARAATFRTGAYYHRAKEGAVKACLLSQDTCDAADAITRFLATYPDYPNTPQFLLAKAQAQLKKNDPVAAQKQLDDLVWNYPWSKAADQAKQLMQKNGFEPRERTYDEVFEHVNFLRSKRFWKIAEVEATQALERFPNDIQLLLQDARIQYEQSLYDTAIPKFQKLYDVLNGEKRDGVRPTGVLSYIYRALGYQGKCHEAMSVNAQVNATLGKKDRLRAQYDYAMTCGAFDEAWEYAKTLDSDLAPYDYGFIAYISREYEIARTKFTEAIESLTGTYKRRARYFLAMATLRSAQKTALEAQKPPVCNEEAACTHEQGELNARGAESSPEVAKQADTPKTSAKTKTSKKSKSSKKSKQKAVPKLPEATLELARKQFDQLIADDSTDYYALLAFSRRAEMDGDPQLEDSPLYMPEAGAPNTHPIDAESPKRTYNQTFTFDEVQTCAKGDFDAFLNDAVKRFGDAWPQLKRIQKLHEAGLYAARNKEFRPILIEGNAITKLAKRPTAKNLWTTALSVDGHLVDNRKNQTGFWGIQTDVKHFDLPGKKENAKREALAQHQQLIFDHKTEIKTFLRDAAILFHDYYLARKYIPTPKSLPGTAKDTDTWSIMYPHAYAAMLAEAAHQNGISPYLLWTLMNIESAFNPDSVSIADAYGLLQIIPITGYKLAEAMHKDPFGPYELIQPENSIPMGAWYFGQIIHKFHGYATLSMAGYNGGPFQVARWLTAYAKKLDHDAFIELIPLNEARNYVKKGLARLLIFKRIDEENPKYFYYIPNSLPDSFEFMPNF